MGDTMKIEITVSMKDIKTIEGLLPSMAKPGFNSFLSTEIKHNLEKKGIKTSVSFGFSGIKIMFEGSIEDVIKNIEDEVEMDLKVIIDAYVHALIAFTAAMKASTTISQEVYKSRKQPEVKKEEEA